MESVQTQPKKLAFDPFSPPSSRGWCPGKEGRVATGAPALISEGLAGWMPGPGPVTP